MVLLLLHLQRRYHPVEEHIKKTNLLRFVQVIASKGLQSVPFIVLPYFILSPLRNTINLKEINWHYFIHFSL